MLDLTAAQQQALAGAGPAPPRVHAPDGSGVSVLLPARDFDWIRGMIEDLPEAPRRLDPRTGQEYALVPVTVYERFKAFFEEDPLGPDERRHLLREFGKRAGWDDPEMDIYDDQPGDRPCA